MSTVTPVTCPDPTCDGGLIEIPGDAIVGDIYECPECAAEVEVTSIDPLQVELVVEAK